MKSIKPFALLRWLLAIVALGVMLAVLLKQSPAPEAQPKPTPDTAKPANNPEPDTAEEVFGSPLPALQSLAQAATATSPAWPC